MSNVPAGWYPNPEDPTQTRYWDGSQWTSHTAPAVAPEPTPAPVSTPAPQYSAHAPVGAPQFSPPPAGPAFGTSAPAATSAGMSSKKKWVIGGAIAAGVIVVGSVGAAIGSGGRTEAAPEASTAPGVAVPTPTPEEVVETTPPAAPVVEAVDAVAFRAQAGSHIDDMIKDLDDIIVTVNEDGFWRLLSNSGELSFNQAQLEGLEVPENVSATWPASLVALQGTLDVLTGAIETQDGPTILAAVEVVRAQAEASRGVVNTAQ